MTRLLLSAAVVAGAALAMSAQAAAAPADQRPSSATTGTVLAPVTARRAPRMSARALTTIQPTAPLGGGAVRLVVTGRTVVAGRPWARVLLPIRPNGSQGWVPAGVLRLGATPLRILIDQDARRLTLFRAGRPILRAPVAVGEAITPTPAGSFAVAELIRTGNPAGFLGPIVFPLTGYSRVLNEYAGGNGRVAIHGTSVPALIGSRASHGCIRMTNADVLRLARLVRPGTPVRITAG